MAAKGFREWFGASRVVDEAGIPLVVFRGEHGLSSDGAHQTRLGSLSFGSAEAASLYATEPNDRTKDEQALSARLIPAYLRIDKPLVDSPDDPFIELGRIRELLGEQEARRIAVKFAEHIEDTGNWQDSFADTHDSAAVFCQKASLEDLDGLYFMAWNYLDDAAEVELLRRAGVDGAIYGGSGANALEPEYRVFSESQVQNAIEARWPTRAATEKREVPPAVLTDKQAVPFPLPLPAPVAPARPARKSSVAKVKKALAELIGEKGVALGEGLGRLVVSTSREIRVPGYGQLPGGVMASFANDPGFRQMLADQRAARKRAVDAIGDVGDCAIVRHDKGDKRWKMILRDASSQGMWRTQSFDEKGFAGHMSFATRDLAIEDAANGGFTVRDDTALDRIQDSPVFQRGLFVSDLIRMVNTRQISHNDGDARLAAYDQAAMALHSLAETGAQAFIAAGGETIYMLADRIDEGSEQAVFLHETMHRYGRSVLGSGGWSRLVGALKSWGNLPTNSKEWQIHDRASFRARKAAGPSTALFDEELLAYAVEEAVNMGIKPKALAKNNSAEQWLDDVVCTLRGVVRVVLGAEEAQVDVQNVVDLAYALAQIDNPQRMEQIFDQMDPQERRVLEGVVARSGASAWYSQLEMRVRLQPQERMPSAQWIGWINAQVEKGVKPDEIHWSGVTDWLATRPADEVIRRDAVLSYLQSNGVKVREVVYGDDEAPRQGEDSSTALMVDLTAMGYLPDIDPVDNDLVGVYRRSDGKSYYFDPDERTFVCNDNAQEEEVLAADVQQVALALGAAMEKESLSSQVREGVAYQDQTLEGGYAYREILLTLPDVAGLNSAEISDSERLVRWADGASGHLQTRDPVQARTVLNRKVPGIYYKSPHWTEPNVLAHVRFNERRDKNGARVLFVEEIQSDWGADGRDNGFDSAERVALLAQLRERKDLAEKALRDFAYGLEPGGEVTKSDVDYCIATIRRHLNGSILLPGLAADEALTIKARTLVNADHEAEQAYRREKNVRSVPRAPFVGSTKAWVSLAVKRVIRYAVDGGFDSVAFINGEQSANRYKLIKHIGSVEFRKTGDQNYRLIVSDTKGRHINVPSSLDADGISGHAGKELAEKIIQTATRQTQWLEGLDVVVGGEGMRAFYDEIVPQVVKEMVRPFGQVLGNVDMDKKTGLGPFNPWDGEGFAIQSADGAFYVGDVVNAWTTDIARAKRFPLMVPAENLCKVLAGRPGVQPGFQVTPRMREIARMGMPLFSMPAVEPIGSVFPDELSQWFKGSLATVNGLRSGDPLMVFRGCAPGDDDVGGQDPVSDKKLDSFWATSSRENAAYYEDGEIQNLYLKLSNPLVLNGKDISLIHGSPARIVDKALADVRAGRAHWDGVIFEDIVDGTHPSVVYAVFPEGGTVKDRVQIVGRTHYTNDGDPVYSGIQPPGDPGLFDRGDDIRVELDWDLQERQENTAIKVLSCWKADPRTATAFESGLEIDTMISKGAIQIESISVESSTRGEAIVSIALESLLYQADRFGVVVKLEMGEDNADKEVMDWYGHMGFSLQGGFMDRQPQELTPTQTPVAVLYKKPVPRGLAAMLKSRWERVSGWTGELSRMRA